MSRIKLTKNMYIIKLYFIVFMMLFNVVRSQDFVSDSSIINKIYTEALSNGDSYKNLRNLCKDIGHRLSGSKNAEKAVQWGKVVLQRYDLDSIWLQPIKVPHWERGIIERLDIVESKNNIFSTSCTALGGSIGTNGAVISGEIIEVNSWEEMNSLGEKNLKGKFVFYNRPMNPTFISTFMAYGRCVDQRHMGASQAAKFGAIGVIVRSMTLKMDKNPHTGSMQYNDSVNKIPAVAISTIDAHQLSNMLKKDSKIKARMKLSCKTLPDADSYNVIGEIKGTEYPNKVIVVGGHLDSWDIGEGAHDDGAGVVQSIEVLKLFKQLGIAPKHTIRCILFMNEENGNRGGESYAEYVRQKGEEHLMAIETDRGGFSPRGFSIDGSDAQIRVVQSYQSLFEPYNLHLFKKGYGGVDIGPLRDGSICLLGLVPDSQRYFDFHHAPTDVFENVNQRELELGSAALTSIIYLIDKYGFPYLETNQ